MPQSCSADFETVFGTGRGSGRPDDPEALIRTLLNPGPLCELRRANGRRVLVRIIRPGDQKSPQDSAFMPGRVHEPRSGFTNPGDECVVEFLDPPTPQSKDKWPTGFCGTGTYYVKTLRSHPGNMEMAFSAAEPGRSIPPEQYQVLLDWLDEQLPRS